MSRTVTRKRRLVLLAVIGLLFSELALSFRLLPGTRFNDHQATGAQGDHHAHAQSRGHGAHDHDHTPARATAGDATADPAHATEDACGCGPDCAHCLAYYASLLVPLPPPEPGADSPPTRGLMPRHRPRFMADHPVSPPHRPPIA